MNENNDTPRTYEIPENFVDESRIIQGMFRTRNFVEGIILALLVVIPSFFIPFGSLQTRIAFMVALGGPLFLVGASGINGDPVSLAIKHLISWRKDGKVMLYNSQTRVLQEAPLDAMMAKPTAGDTILDIMDKIRDKRKERASDIRYIEGETFEFEEDEELVDLYVTDDEDEEFDESNPQKEETEGNESASDETEPAPEEEPQSKQKKKKKAKKDRKKKTEQLPNESAFEQTQDTEAALQPAEEALQTTQDAPISESAIDNSGDSPTVEPADSDNDVEVEIDLTLNTDDQEGDLF